MTAVVHAIKWDRTSFAIEYTSPAGEDLFLYRKKTNSWLSFDNHRTGENVKACINLALAGGREPVEAGEWIICQRLSEHDLSSEQSLYQKKPYMEAVAKRAYLDSLPVKERKSSWAEKAVENNAFAYYKTLAYDVQSVKYSDAILLDLEAYQRVFRYGGGKYAYTAILIPRSNVNDCLFLVLSLQFYEVNKTPKIRKHSVRFAEKRAFSALYKLISFVCRKQGNSILFLKENGDKPSSNMAALRDRMFERGLDKQFKIKTRYRNTFSPRQNILEWLVDMVHIAKADYIFVDDYTPIFGFIRPDDNTVLTQIWHAGVGFKSVGYARFGLAGSPDPYASSHRAYTYALVGNEHLRDIYSEVFGIEKEALLATGMPRLDHFLDQDRAEKARENLYGKYEWLNNGRVVLFAPTYRGTGQRTAYYPYVSFFDISALYEVCESTNSYFIFEMHHFISELPQIPEEYKDRIFDLSHESLDDLFHVSDVLVTDYSSCFYDYLLLEKPVVFYVPDKVDYSAIRGVQRPIDDMAPGKVCETFSEFMDTLVSGDYATIEPHPSSIDRCIEGGMLASDRAIDTIIFGKDVPGVRYK